MNHESTDFAAQRFSPRTASDYSHFYAGRFYKPPPDHTLWRVAAAIVCIAAAMAIGAALALGSRA